MKKTKKVKSKKKTKTSTSHKISKHPNLLQQKFLAAYSNNGIIFQSAKIAGIARDDHYRWLRDDLTYKTKFIKTKAMAIEFLEDVAVDRASQGWLDPVYHQGKKCGDIRKYSDTLLIFTLKGLAPEKYRERFDNKLSGETTQTIKIITNGEGKSNGT